MAAKKRGKSGHICEREERDGVGMRMSQGGEGRRWEWGWEGKEGNGYRGGEEGKGRGGGERVREEGDSQLILKCLSLWSSEYTLRCLFKKKLAITVATS